jgi:hypothetical protein
MSKQIRPKTAAFLAVLLISAAFTAGMTAPAIAFQTKPAAVAAASDKSAAVVEATERA